MISWASLWRILFFALFVVVLFQGRQVLVGLFLAIVVSSGLEIIVNFLEQKGVPRTLGVVLIFFLTLLLLIAVIYTLVPRIIVELNAIRAGLDDSSFSKVVPFIDSRTSQIFGDFVHKLSAEFFTGNISPLGIFSRALGGVGLAVAVLVTSFYLSLSRDGVERFLRVVLPSDYEKQGLRIYERSRKKIGAWFRMQIVLSILIGSLVWGALAILGVKHAFLLGVLAGLFELVPYVGPILSGAAATLMAFATSPTLALYTLVVFLGLHQLESHVFVPILTRKVVGLHPVVVITAMLIGAEVWGLLGLLIAVPAAAVFEEVIDEWSVSRKKPAVA
ncbi:MAG: AI-2E family transporter [Patescibacteria group bacterium]